MEREIFDGRFLISTDFKSPNLPAQLFSAIVQFTYVHVYVYQVLSGLALICIKLLSSLVYTHTYIYVIIHMYA